MSKTLVIVFPDDKDFAEILEATKDLFSRDPTIAVEGAVDDVAEKVLNALKPVPQSNLVDHARRELALIGNDLEFNESIIAAIRAFSSYGHLGGSASVAIPMINDLLQFKNLTPLTDDPAEWNEVTDNTWQSSRRSEAFSNDGGGTYYLLSEGSTGRNPQPLHTSVGRKK